jgi:TonB family protein
LATAPTELPAAISTPSQGELHPATITERIPKVNSTSETRIPEKSVEIVEPGIKKPLLGNVRLAKPKVGGTANVQANGAIEPTFELSGDAVSAGENSLAANFVDATKQPAAPVAIGGDVKPARMISSVPPIYPALAKTQHVAGDVRVDALVDVNGRVTTMKVVSGPSLLHQSAMDALRQWRYQAATLDGKPVPMHLTVTIQFRLK